MIKKPVTENERLFSSVLLVFIVYFGLNSIIFSLFGRDTIFVHYLMTFSFLGGMACGVLFFLWTNPKSKENGDINALEKNIRILKKALSEDERILVDMIREAEGLTQDSLRFRTGFSKSKVSYLVSELEKKDVIVRERLGRTYKLFISDWLRK
ncbi:MAG: hypothetical protein V3T58_05495 [Candidatus Hydrothermarchaeales archaeon]